MQGEKWNSFPFSFPLFGFVTNCFKEAFMAYIQKRIGQDGASFSYKVTIKHRSKFLKSKTFKTKRLAKIWAKKIEDDLELIEAYANEGARLTLRQLAEEFINNYKGKDHSSLFARIRWWVGRVGDYKLTDINNSMVRAYLKEYENGNCLRYAGMDANAKHRVTQTSRSRTPATVNRMKMTLSTLYRYAENEGYLTYNPTKGIKSKPENNERLHHYQS